MRYFPYKWRLSDGYPKKLNGFRAFGTFVCGGGSTMGYKLAGFDHLGGVELTEHYSRIYRKNHAPKYFFTEDIRRWNLRDDLPEELFGIDLLDGSPPCASFSTAGKREKLWGRTKTYEGHKQKTDDLVFEFVKTIEKLRPKTFLMENVPGLIKGNAKAYVAKLLREIDAIGYRAQIFQVDAVSVGLPQMRLRVFIIGHRKEYALPKLSISFSARPISFLEATREYWDRPGGASLGPYSTNRVWNEINWPRETAHPKHYSMVRPALDRPCNTLTEMASQPGAYSVAHPTQPRKLNREEASVLQSFPLDYDFDGEEPLSAIGRSVPPILTASISSEVARQWLANIPK